MKRSDADIRELLRKNDIPEPGSDLHLTDVRYAMRGGSWYVQNKGGAVYWLDDGMWKICPMKRHVGDD